MYHGQGEPSSFLALPRNFLRASAAVVALAWSLVTTAWKIMSSEKKTRGNQGPLHVLKLPKAEVFHSYWRLIWLGAIFVPFQSISLPFFLIRSRNSKSARFCFIWVFTEKSGQRGFLYGVSPWVKGLDSCPPEVSPPAPEGGGAGSQASRLADEFIQRQLWKDLHLDSTWRWPSHCAMPSILELKILWLCLKAYALRTSCPVSCLASEGPHGPIISQRDLT